MAIVKSLILALTVATGSIALEETTTFAATPALHLSCGIPNPGNLVACRLSGSGFHPREKLRISYRITFTALPRRHGRLPQKAYQRHGMTDRRGRFTRPPLSFTVVRYHESYRLTVTVSGATGDHASTTFVAIAQ